MVTGHGHSAMRFSKMHGAGNDFVVLDLRGAPPPSADLCRALADRHTGVGCDLILGVDEPRNRDSVASYRIWTSEGLPSRQCGNGARCVAAWVVRAGMARGATFLLDSPFTTHVVEMLPGDAFRVAMGVPRFQPDEIPLAGFEREQAHYDADIEGGPKLRLAAVSMGNPHAVILVDDVKVARVAELGRALQSSRYFPQSVNVGFVEVVSRHRIKLRVYEFGAGETLACGTGACAAAVTLMRERHIDRRVSVTLPGGQLEVAWDNNAAEVLMSGPATFVFEGVLDRGEGSPIGET